MQIDDKRPVILVVDDDPDVCEILELMLEEEGFRVVTAQNGADALGRLVTGLGPAAIILDLMMPVMSGWEFWDIMQSSPRYKRLPIIVLTASGLTQGALGAVRILGKPVGRDVLKDTLLDVCSAAT